MLVKDIKLGRSASITAIYCGECEPPYNGGELTDVRGTLYFSANDGKHGFELWRSDGTARGTRMVRDINPGRGWSDLSGITAVNRIIYFTADDGTHGAELWRSDGTARGTRMVKDINPGPGSGSPGELTDLNGTVYFSASEGNYVSELWRSDGTEAGTTLVKQLSGGPFSFADVNATLYFDLFNGSTSGLWRSDGTEAGTSLVKGPFGGTPELTDFNGALYFGADDGVHGPALWRSDGTEAGTTLVKALTPTVNPNPPCCLADVKGTLFFFVSSEVRGGPISYQLWRSDGTEAGTTLVKQIRFPFGFTAFKGALYFSDLGELWRSDGTPQGTTLVRGNLAGYFSQFLTAAKGTLYFAGSDRRHGQELWRSDGTRKGTRMVRNIRRGSASSEPGNLTAVGDTLFFTAKDGRHGRELWRAGPRPCKTAKGKCKKG